MQPHDRSNYKIVILKDRPRMSDKIDKTVEERVAWRSYIYIYIYDIYFNKRVSSCRKYWQMLQSCLWILKTDSLLTNVDNYNPKITTVKSSIFNFSGFVGPSLINDHHICHFLLFSCFYLIHAIFGEHVVCRISSQDIFL